MFKYIFDYSSSIDLCLGDLKVTRVHDKKNPFAHKRFQFLEVKEGEKSESPFPDPFPNFSFLIPASNPPFLLLYTPSSG